jgi:hypothetical protein
MVKSVTNASIWIDIGKNTGVFADLLAIAVVKQTEV